MCFFVLFDAGRRGSLVAEMASPSGASPLSLRNGVRVASPPGSSVEQVLLAIGGQVGHENISYASRMNKALVVFVSDQKHVSALIESGLTLDGEFVQVSPLAVPSTRITVSAVPPFIPNEALERELRRYGKFASGFKSVGLGCKSEKLQHVQSLRRQVFMYLDTPTLDISFRVKHDDAFYMVYASSGSLKCFECGDVGHKRVACPHRPAVPLPGPVEGASGAGAVPAGPAPEPEPGQRSYAGVLMNAPASPTAVKRAAEAERPGSKESVGSPEATATVPECAATLVPLHDGAHAPSTGKKRKMKKRGSTSVDDKNSVLTSESEGSDGEKDNMMNPKADHTQAAAMETDGEMDSDSASVADSGSQKSDLYSLHDVNEFLDETFGKSVEVTDYFPDIVKFIQSISTHQKTAGLDELDERRRYRLAKHVATLRKRLRVKKASLKGKLSAP